MSKNYTMRIIKNILTNITLMKLAILITMTLVINIFSMKVSEMEKDRVLKKRMMQQRKELKELEEKKQREQKKRVKQIKKELKEVALRRKKTLETQIQREIQREREKQHQSGKFFIYEQGTSNGISVDAAKAKNLSQSIKDMVSDLGSEPKEISFPFPATTIQTGFKFLQNPESKLTYDQLIKIADFFDYLSVSDDKLYNILARIRQDIESQNDTKIIDDLNHLSLNLQNLLMLIPVINYLKFFIITKTPNYNNLLRHRTVFSAKFSPDGKKIAAGTGPSSLSLGSFIFWDQNLHEFKTQSISSVAFSPNGEYVIAAGEPYLHNNNIHNNTYYKFNTITKEIESFGIRLPANATTHSVTFFPNGEHFILGDNAERFNLKIISKEINNALSLTAPHAVNSVVCTPDSKAIIAGCDGEQNNLLLWDISKVNWDNPKTEDVVMTDISDGSFNNVTSLSLNHNGSKLVSGSKDGSLILWNIKERHNITKQLLTRYDTSVNSVAFSHDGKNILVGLSGNELNLDLWDITDIKNIVHNRFTGTYSDIYTVAFSPDDKIILVGGKYTNPFYSTFIEWEILTDQEAATLDDLKNYTPEQIRLIYKLCLNLKKQIGILKLNQLNTSDQKIFETLPKDMQELLHKIYRTGKWF